VNNEEVCQRWLKLYHSHSLIDLLFEDKCSYQAVVDNAQEIVIK